MINDINSGKAPYFSFFDNNCTTVCEDALHDLGLDFGDITPEGFWTDVYDKFSPDVQDNPFKLFARAPGTPGYDYGNPRSGFNTSFIFGYWLGSSDDKSSVTTTETYSIDCQKNPGACK